MPQHRLTDPNIGICSWTDRDRPDEHTVDEIYMKLKSYEDTGFFPSDIEQMRTLYQAVITDLFQLNELLCKLLINRC